MGHLSDGAWGTHLDGARLRQLGLGGVGGIGGKDTFKHMSKIGYLKCDLFEFNRLWPNKSSINSTII